MDTVIHKLHYVWYKPFTLLQTIKIIQSFANSIQTFGRWRCGPLYRTNNVEWNAPFVLLSNLIAKTKYQFVSTKAILFIILVPITIHNLTIIFYLYYTFISKYSDPLEDSQIFSHYLNGTWLGCYLRQIICPDFKFSFPLVYTTIKKLNVMHTMIFLNVAIPYKVAISRETSRAVV